MIAGFYRCAVEEELLGHFRLCMSAGPAGTVSLARPGWTATGPVPYWSAAGLGTAAGHALISLLALNGLRVSEATGAGIQALGAKRGYRTLVITLLGRQGRHHPARAAAPRAIGLAIGERCPCGLLRHRGG